MLKASIIGGGNAGNQIAELGMKERKISGLALNSSEHDFTSISCVPTIIIGDGKGAGKDRDVAKVFMKEQAVNLFGQEIFTQLIIDSEIVFVVSSTGGGSGSGMCPVLTSLMAKRYPEKKFIIIHILPPLKETLDSQENTIDYWKELRKIPNVTYMSYDNNRRCDMSTDEMMVAVNREILDDIDVLRGVYMYATPFSSIDDKDLRKLVSTPGRLAVFSLPCIKEKDLDKASIEDLLIDVIKNKSSQTELQRDMDIKRLGLVTNLTEKMKRQLNVDIPIIKGFIGEPIEGFQHIYINDQTENRVSVILAGLGIPDDRIEKIAERIQEIEEKSAANNQKESILDTIETSSIKDIRKELNCSDNKESSGVAAPVTEEFFAEIYAEFDID